MNEEKDIRSKIQIALEAIGWAYADCCVTLDNGKDPRLTDMGDVLKRAIEDLQLKDKK